MPGLFGAVPCEISLKRKPELCCDKASGVASAGPVTVAADAVLHDRGRIDAQLGSHGYTDAQVILFAWRRWGPECVEHLEGEFAFALWDARSHSLFCARDRFGIRPFYYRGDKDGLLFASNLGKLQRPSDSVRDAAVAQFLAGTVFDDDSTFFCEIARLPAAHSLLFRHGEITLRRYWQLRPAEVPGSAEERAEEFRHLFLQAVQEVTSDSSRAKTGALLSGGLDSSSIVCALTAPDAAQTRPVRTYSLAFSSKPEWDERSYVNAVLHKGGCESSIYLADGYAPLEHLQDCVMAHGEPFLAPNLACMQPLLGMARADGLGAMLDGHGGDEVVSHGYGLLDELFMRRKYRRAWHECEGAAANFGQPRGLLFAALSARHGLPGGRLAARLMMRRGETFGGGRANFIAPQFAREAQLAALQSAARRNPRAGEAEQHIRSLTAPIQTHAFEVMASSYARNGMVGRYPFWTRKLVEFCVGVPAQDKLSAGCSRLIMRRALKDLLPSAVRNRRDKLNFGPALAEGMARRDGERIDALLVDGEDALGDYVDLPEVQSAWQHMRSCPDDTPGHRVQAIWRVVALATWLQARGANAASRERATGYAA
ncbi:asparagine synthase-related protein [Aurantiacibacter poecillastricola]|uniref:asparagine synthase-related protein n=1 Tax=Aurantiacibacter poecillastricola TaxID=3064385 RepID=UPI00273FB5AE|nr:asparagine synthase-related protein [Aurantiacibacter sp. 219JJ12-13]MDP5263228.1 asparagine synthase-related protein [Aurantiacibacter sp. 219JJ12-13]